MRTRLLLFESRRRFNLDKCRSNYAATPRDFLTPLPKVISWSTGYTRKPPLLENVLLENSKGVVASVGGATTVPLHSLGSCRTHSLPRYLIFSVFVQSVVRRPTVDRSCLRVDFCEASCSMDRKLYLVIMTLAQSSLAPPKGAMHLIANLNAVRQGRFLFQPSQILSILNGLPSARLFISNVLRSVLLRVLPPQEGLEDIIRTRTALHSKIDYHPINTNPEKPPTFTRLSACRLRSAETSLHRQVYSYLQVTTSFLRYCSNIGPIHFRTT